MKIRIDEDIINKNQVQEILETQEVQNFFQEVLGSWEFTEDHRNHCMCGGFQPINLSSHFNLGRGVDVILDPQTEIVWVEKI